MELKKGKEILFNNNKFFQYIEPIGEGGTGEIHLFLDTTTEMRFAIKKYFPYDENYREEFYQRFVDEIKILFKLSHPNIVRIYNYYLYPQHYFGYLQMEYIEGTTIDKYSPTFFDKDWNEIFNEIISAFCYLEEKKILHRDIRASNIMITNNQEIKIIDFGFGKNYKNLQEEENSIMLNWPVSELPEEVNLNKEYNQQSEIYFLGKLFYNLLEEKNELENFKYFPILRKMCQIKLNRRYCSFYEIEQDISKGLFQEINFSDSEKEIYLNFANSLEGKIKKYNNKPSFVTDSDEITKRLNNVIKNHSLEDFIQNNSNLIDVFVEGLYLYNPYKNISIDIVKDFFQFYCNLDSLKQQIVLNNLYSRLSSIEIEYSDDGFPF